METTVTVCNDHLVSQCCAATTGSTVPNLVPYFLENLTLFSVTDDENREITAARDLNCDLQRITSCVWQRKMLLNCNKMEKIFFP